MGQIVATFQAQPSVRQSLTLGGAQFELRLTWRDRPGGGAWYADLWDATGAEVWLGQRVSTRWGLGLGLLPPGAPDGVLFVRGPEEYERADLGDTVQIVFYPAEELPEPTVTGLPLTVTTP